MHVLRLVAPLLCLLCLLAGSATAAASAESLLGDAVKSFAAGDEIAAAHGLGRAAAAAQKSGDVRIGRRVAGTLETLLVTVKRAERQGVKRTQPSLRELTDRQRVIVAAALSELDPGRTAAFVSVPSLAQHLLFSASEHGDTEHVVAAADAMRRHATGRARGRHTAVLLRHAEGMAALAGGDGRAAAGHFEAAFAAAAEQRWIDLAAHAGTELAWVREEAGDRAATEAALRAVAELFQGDVSGESARAWTRAVQSRLPKGATDLAKIVNEATGRLTPSRSDPTDDSESSGKSKLTRLGKAFKKIGAKTAIARISRTDTGLKLDVLFKPKSSELLIEKSGLRRLDRGGLLLVARGRAVGVEDMQTENYDNFAGAPMTGREDAQPALRSAASLALVRADYPLALAESWSVTKTGAVKID